MVMTLAFVGLFPAGLISGFAYRLLSGACLRGVEFAEAVLDAGADPNLGDAVGETPLDAAMFYLAQSPREGARLHHRAIADLLISRGALRREEREAKKRQAELSEYAFEWQARWQAQLDDLRAGLPSTTSAALSHLLEVPRDRAAVESFLERVPDSAGHGAVAVAAPES